MTQRNYKNIVANIRRNGNVEVFDWNITKRQMQYEDANGMQPLEQYSKEDQGEDFGRHLGFFLRNVAGINALDRVAIFDRAKQGECAAIPCPRGTIFLNTEPNFSQRRESARDSNNSLNTKI